MDCEYALVVDVSVVFSIISRKSTFLYLEGCNSQEVREGNHCYSEMGCSDTHEYML